MAESNKPILRGYKQTAKETGLPVWALRTLVWSGELSVLKIGKKHYLDQREVQRVIEEKKEFYRDPPHSMTPQEREKRFHKMRGKCLAVQG